MKHSFEFGCRVNVGGNADRFIGRGGRLPTWQFDLDRDGDLDDDDVIRDGAEDRALGIARLDENDTGSLAFEIEIADSPLRAFTLDWDLEIWGGDPEASFRGSEGGGGFGGPGGAHTRAVADRDPLG